MPAEFDAASLPTESDFRAALTAQAESAANATETTADALLVYGAINPAQILELAKKLAKQAPKIIPALDILGIALPPGGAASAEVIVQVIGVLGKAGLLDPAAA